MVSHTTFNCDDCGVAIDYLDMYDVHISIRYPIRDWEENRIRIGEMEHWLRGERMPSYIADKQLCAKCYKKIENTMGDNRLRSLSH